MKVSVVIPMYNESAVIEQTAKRLSDFMSGSFEDYEIVFSDDGSTDGCADLVCALDLPCARGVGCEQNHGKGFAVRAGVLASVGEIVVFTDADLAYGTEVILRAVQAMTSAPACGMLIGSRNLEENGYGGYGWLRRFLSRNYIRLLCLFGGFRLSDSQCGFKAFRREAADRIFSDAKVDGFAFDFEIILRAQKAGIVISELPVRVLCHGHSNVRLLRDSTKMLADLYRIRRMVNKEK